MILDDNTKHALDIISQTFKYFTEKGHTVEEATRLCEIVMKTGQAGRQPGAVAQK